MLDETTPSPEGTNPLDSYALNGRTSELQELAQEQVPLLGGLAVKGQAGVWYAGPNVGKTLTAVKMLKLDVEEGRLKGSDCYYAAADDSAAGALDKLAVLEPLDVQVIVPGFHGFRANNLPNIIESSIVNGTAKRRFLILDTMKKFTNLMDKGNSSGFAALFRKFTLHGGSVLGLAHTNKRADQDGNPIFAGTSDIRDDFDYAFTMKKVPSVIEGRTMVQADCIKSRGCVVQQALLSYPSDTERPYPDLVASLQLISQDEHKRLMAEIEMAQDAEVIAAVIGQIQAGTTGKMAIARQAARELMIGRNTVDAIIDKYTGRDPDRHHWTYDVRDRGLRVYRVLHGSSAVRVNEPEPVF